MPMDSVDSKPAARDDSLEADGDRAASVTPRRRRPARETFTDIALRAASILFLILVWWVLSLFFPPTLVPTPRETFAEVGAIIQSGELFTEMGATLRRVGVGFAIAIVFSIPVGIFMGTVKAFESFFEPPVVLGLTMPGLIWPGLAIMFFG